MAVPTGTRISLEPPWALVPILENVGLGRALEIGVKACSHDLIARADTDDINTPQRFERQVQMFQEHPELDLVGSSIAEFYDHPEQVKFIKLAPVTHQDILAMAKRRNPLNHMTVMFRKQAVLDAGNYQHLFFLEDYYLWVRMLQAGSRMANIAEPLVHMRTGEGMYARRSNRRYIGSWLVLQRFMHAHGMISVARLWLNMVGITVFIFSPIGLKKLIYRVLLRAPGTT